MNNKQRNYAALEANISIVLNTVLAGLKYWAALMSGSLALSADAWHTFSDSFSSLVVIVSSRLARKPADREHPFGHGRFEILGTIIIGLMLGAVAYHFFTSSLERLTERTSADYGWLALGVTAFSMVFKELMARFAFWAARRSRESTSLLKADGWHHRSDAFSSLILLIGVIFGKYYWWADGVLGILLALFIFYTAIRLIFEAVNQLLGEAPSPAFEKDVREVVKSMTENREPHHLHIHRYGRHLEATFHVRLPGGLSLRESHGLITRIENRLREIYGLETTIHPEPE